MRIEIFQNYVVYIFNKIFNAKFTQLLIISLIQVSDLFNVRFVRKDLPQNDFLSIIRVCIQGWSHFGVDIATKVNKKWK